MHNYNETPGRPGVSPVTFDNVVKGLTLRSVTRNDFVVRRRVDLFWRIAAGRTLDQF